MPTPRRHLTTFDVPRVRCYSVAEEVYSYLAIEIPEPIFILPNRDGQTDCIFMGMNLLSSCPTEVPVLCLTNSSLKDQQVLVAQILLKWHLLVSASSERHAGISKWPLNDQVEVHVCGGYLSVLPFLEEISCCSYSFTTVNWASVLEATNLVRGDGIRSAPWEILSADGVASAEYEPLSKLWADALNTSHLKGVSLRQRSIKAQAELVSQLNVIRVLNWASSDFTLAC